VDGELQPQIDIHKAVSRLFFFSLFLWWDNDRTRTGCWRTNWNCIAFELGIFLFVCLFLFFPLWWDNNRTTLQAPTPGLEAEGQTKKLIRLKLYCIWTWGFLFLFFLSALCLSNTCLAYRWLVYYLSLFISLALFLFVFVCVCLFCFVSLFLYLLCFSSPLTLPL
jgi:hypothetical protein